MHTIKKHNKKQAAKNAYRMIAEKSLNSGESIESIALSLEISERTIYYWQKGERTPSADHLYRLSQWLGVSMERILV
jgi:transcriptional regulator with XRE-family HTH domain